MMYQIQNIPNNLGEKVPVSSVCVYCGSSNTVPQTFKDLAKKVGESLAARKIKLIYGGGHVGLMGITADGVMQNGGEVIGIIPEHIRAQEVQHMGLTKLHVVPDMHTRKRMMADFSDAFVILPGGLGTLDEAFEILTWRKLKLHDKPVVIFNHEGYWDTLLALIETTIENNFSGVADRKLYTVVTDLDGMYAALNQAKSGQTTLTDQM